MYLRFESITGRISAQDMDNFNHFWTADRRVGLGRVFRVAALLCLAALAVTANVESRSPATAKPDGKMRVDLDGGKITTVEVKDGKAKFRLPKLDAGKHTLKAKFQKSGNVKDSAGKKTVQVKT